MRNVCFYLEEEAQNLWVESLKFDDFLHILSFNYKQNNLLQRMLQMDL